MTGFEASVRWASQVVGKMEIPHHRKGFSVVINKGSVDENHFIHRQMNAAAPLQNGSFIVMNKSIFVSLRGV
jgi:hypothetical protein